MRCPRGAPSHSGCWQAWPRCSPSRFTLLGTRAASKAKSARQTIAPPLVGERQKIEQELLLAKRESMILMDPSSIKIALKGSDAQGPQLGAKWHSQWGVVVMGENIPMPSPHHVLQLWFIPKAPGKMPMPSMMVR